MDEKKISKLLKKILAITKKALPLRNFLKVQLCRKGTKKNKTMSRL
jgi:hypothetical protein